jgi:hypothetical protein
MRKTAAIVLSFFLMSGVAFADTPKDGDPQPAQTEKKKKSTKPPAKSATAILAEQVEALRQTLETQQQQIQQLRSELAQRDAQIGDAKSAAAAADAKAVEANTKVAEIASSTAEVKTTTTALSSDVTDLKLGNDSLKGAVQDSQKKIIATEGKIRGIGPFTFSGDIRLRYEPFFSGGAKNTPEPPDRHRFRYRLRFNVNAKYEDFSGGLTLASGDIGDPISTNSTETGFFTRKAFFLDKAFATYNPHFFKPLSVTGGKFAYTWYRTELTWDNDLNPEGISETLAWDWKDRFFSHFAVIGFQMPLFEVNTGGTPIPIPPSTFSASQRAEDSSITGGQVQTGWRLGSRLKLLADVAYYDYKNPDRIAQNQNQGNGLASSGTSTNLGGTFGFGGSGNTNNFADVTWTTVSGTTSTTTTERLFLSKFGILDAVVRADLDTGHARWPVYALFNYAQNTRACENVPFVTSQLQLAANLKANAGDPTGGNTAAPVTAPTCDARQRNAHWAEISAGRTTEKHDVRLAYTFIRIEKDAVVSAFNFSDLRQPTNNLNHRVEFFYLPYKNITLGFTGLIGRQIVTAQSPTEERWLKRLQFDMIYKF